MKKFAKKLVARNYRKRIVAMLIAAVVLIVAIAVLVPVTMHKQIEEFRALEKAQEKQEDIGNENQIPEEQISGKKHNGKEQGIKSMLRQLTPIGIGTKAVFAVVAFLAFLLGAFYWITVAEWLYKMAVIHEMNRALWPMLGLMFNVLVIPVLLIVLCDPKRAGKQVS